MDDIRPKGITLPVVAASVCAHVLSLAIPLALLQTYDRILPNRSYATTVVLAIGVTVAILLEAALRYGRAVLFARAGAAVESKVILRVFTHLLRANGNAVHKLGAPELSDALRAVGQARDFWSGSAAASLHELPFVLIYIGLIAYLGAWLALIPLVLVFVGLIAALLISRGAQRAQSDAAVSQADRRQITWGIFSSIVLIKAMAAEMLLTRRYRDIVARNMDAANRLENLEALIRENGSLLAQLSTIAVVTCGAFMVIDGQLTTGGLAACTILSGRSISPALAAFAYLARRGHRDEAERKVSRVLSLPLAPLWSGGSGVLTFTGGTIDIAGDVIDGGSVSIKPGSFVRVEAEDALTRTSFLESIAQLDDCLGLKIQFDGQPSSAFDPVSLQHRIVLASARTELVLGTLLDNLTLFSPQYNAEAIKLVDQLGMNAFVAALRRGVMTTISPSGRDNVSPGIAVRIGLARALARHPAVLCIDEVGGALDLDGIRRLAEVLKSLKGHTTVFLASSNPALMQLADATIGLKTPDAGLAKRDATASITPAPIVGRPSPPREAEGWSETVWLDRLSAVVGVERRSRSPIAANLPAMLVALGWPGTGRTLAALLPPPEVPMSLRDLEHLLADLGFRTSRITPRGTAADTARLRAGSVVQRATGVAVYLGQPDGKDRWLVNQLPGSVQLTSRDIILSVEPDPEYRPIDEARPGWFRSLFERIRNELFVLFAMSAVINLLALPLPLYTMVVYGSVIPSGSTASVWGLALFAAVAVIGTWALRVGRQTVISSLGTWAGTRIGEATMRKMLSISLDTTTKLGVQNNILRMRSFESARQFLSGPGGIHLIDYPFVLIFLVTIGLMGGWMVFVPIISLLLYVALAFPTADYVSGNATLAGLAAGHLDEQAWAGLMGINAFYRTGGGSQWLTQFTDCARESANRNADYAIAIARAQTIGQALSELTVLATLCIGVVLVLSGDMGPGGLIAAMILIWRIVVPAQEAFGSLIRLRQVGSSVGQVDQLMATQTERASVEIASPVGLSTAALTVERLYYRPDAEQEPTLNGVSFAVAAGTRASVVGPNAAGKTALLECLVGIRQPQSGRVLINGRDIRQFDLREYRAWVGYVPQVVPALPVTVRDYLRLRIPSVEDKDALLWFEHVLGAGWSDLPPFTSKSGVPLLDVQLNPLSEDHVELKLRYLVTFVAATIGAPAVLLLDGVGLEADPLWDTRIESYLDSVRGRTTVIWAPYTTAHMQKSDQMVILERGNIRYTGPTTQPKAAAE